MDRRAAIGGAFRFLLTGGSWMRLALWVKASPSRSLNLRLVYPVGEPLWTMQLTDGETIVFEETSESLEGVTVLAVAKLGKSL